MLETPHVVVGAAIATAIPNPALAIPLSFASHFVLERVPHWNPHLNQELKKHGKITGETIRFLIADSSIALIFGSAVAYQALPNTAHAVTILLSCLASVLPDVVEIPYFFFKSKNKLLLRWIKWQKSIQVDTTPLPGLATQFLTIAAALWWLLS